MRDPERIDRILELIEEKWKNHPDLRLFQLLENCLPENIDDAYFTEDDILEQSLKSW